MQNVIKKIVVVSFLSFNFLPLSITQVMAQTPNNSAAELGRAVGTLLGNIFSRGSGDSGSSGSSGSEALSQENNLSGPTQESMTAFKLKNEQIKSQNDSICASEKFAAFFKKSPCNNSDMVISHLTDETKATPEEKKLIAMIDVEYLNIAQLQAENYRLNVKPVEMGESIAQARMKFRVNAQKNLQDLYLGKISWGQYNTKRREIAEAGQAEFVRLSKGGM